MPWPQDRNKFVSRVSYGLVAEIGTQRYPRLEDAVSKARRRVLEWVGEQMGVGDLSRLGVTQAFDRSDQPGVKYGVALSPDAKTWIAKMERPDREVPQRSWMTEAAVVSQAKAAFLVVRNTCTAPAADILLPRSVPYLVKSVSRIVGLYDADESLDRAAWYIQSEEDVEDLRALVTSPERFLPVVLVSEPYALDVDGLAAKLYGVAHVVALPDKFSYDWTAAIGRPFSAFLGAVRTYNVGIDLEQSEPYDHPMALRDRIYSYAANGQSGADAFSALLIERAYSSNAGRIVLDPRGTRYSQVSAAALEARREVAAASASPQDALDLATAEIEAYKKQAEEATLMETAALEDNQGLSADNDHLKQNLFQMQMEVARMQSTLEAAGKVVEDPPPEDFNNFEDFIRWSERNLSGRVLLLPRALRELKSSEYSRPPDIFAGLLLLANEFWRMKAGLLSHDVFTGRLAELGFEYDGSIEERNADETYYVTYNGVRRFMDMAIKAGTSREPRYCMRIYTFWDNERRLSIVGSLPRHLDNTLS